MNDLLWKCPHCECVDEFNEDMPKDFLVTCGECGDKSAPHDNIVTWEEFWGYCRSLKDI